MGFSLFIQLVMWTRTILFTVGAHKLKSICIRANPRADTAENEKLIECCCALSQTMIFQKELQVKQS